MKVQKLEEELIIPVKVAQPENLIVNWIRRLREKIQPRGSPWSWRFIELVQEWKPFAPPLREHEWRREHNVNPNIWWN